MMQSIRNWSQSWMAWALVIFICGTFALFGISSYFYGDSSNKAVATVNGKAITVQALTRAVERMQRMEVLRTGKKLDLPQAAQKALEQQILQQLITAQILAGAALNQGFNVSMEEAKGILMNMPAFQVNGQFSPARFQEALANLLYTPQEFLENLKRDILISQIRGGFADTDFALPNEVEQAATLLAQERSIRYLVLPASSAKGEAEKQITPFAIKTYYNTHQDMFATPAQVKIQYLVLSLQELAKKTRLDEASLKQYYQDNLEQYTQPARWQLSIAKLSSEEEANKVYQEMKAEKNSRAATKPSWYLASQLEEAIQDALRNEHSPAVLKPIALDEGFVVVKVLGYKPEHTPSYQEMAASIKTNYMQQQAKGQFAELSEQLADLSFEHPNSLEPAANKLGLKLQETDFFTEQGGKDSILQNEAIIKAAFNPEILDSGNNSDLIQLNNNEVAVIRVLNSHPAGIEALPIVENRIKQILMALNLNKLLKTQGDKIVEELNSGDADKVLAKHHLNWQKTVWINRSNKDLPKGILQVAFSLPKSSTAARGILLPNGDYAIVALDKVKEGNLNAITKIQSFSEQKLMEELSDSYGLLDFDLYVRTQLTQSKIK